MRQELCDITVVLDRSGSMESLKKEMTQGFNNWITEQTKLPGEATVTLVQFDSVSTDTVYSAKPVNRVPPLDLTPRGGTPLLDAVGRTIVETGKRLKALPASERPGKVLFVILTDGEENASQEWSKDRVQEAVKHQRETYSWEFIFLGIGIDAFHEAHGLGIHGKFVSSTPATAAGVQVAFNALRSSSDSYRSGGSAAITPDQA